VSERKEARRQGAKLDSLNPNLSVQSGEKALMTWTLSMVRENESTINASIVGNDRRTLVVRAL